MVRQKRLAEKRQDEKQTKIKKLQEETTKQRRHETRLEWKRQKKT